MAEIGGIQVWTKSIDEALECLCNKSVVTLRCREAELSDEAGQKIAKALKLSSVTDLNLSDNELGLQTAKALTSCLKNKHCRLQILNLENNQLGVEGAKQLAKALSSKMCKLTSLNLGDCDIGDDGVAHIASALSSENCHISLLNLSDNEITSDGAAHIASALSSENCNLTVLNMENNSLEEEGAEVVAEAICTANSITSLDISGNSIGDVGCSHIASALQHKHNKIIEIDLRFNELKLQGFNDIVSALKHKNCKVTEIDQISWCAWLLSHRFPLEIITAIVHARPLLANCKDRHGKLPLNHVSENIVHASSDDIVVLTKALYQETASNIRDFNNQSRADICATSTSELVRDWAEKLGTKYRRYRLENPVVARYKSKSSEVYFAVDVTNDQRVAIKIVWEKAGFDSERATRNSVELSKDFVVPALGFYDPENGLETENGDVDEEAANGMTGTSGAPEWEGKRSEYAIIMPRCDRNLNEVISMERVAHDAFAVVSIATQIAQCLDHLHSNNLIHGDIKPRNIVREGTVWKLIDLDAATEIDTPIGRKLCSAYMPPELAKLVYDEDGIPMDFSRMRRPQPKFKKTAASGSGSGSRRKKKQKNNKRSPEAPTTLLGRAKPSFDVWMFGCLLYELCTGSTLFPTLDKCDDDSTSDKVRKELRRWTVIDNTRLSHVFQYENFDDRKELHHVKKMARNLIRQCLQGDPLKRMNSMQQVLNSNFCQLAGLRSSKKINVKKKTKEKEKKKKKKKHMQDTTSDNANVKDQENESKVDEDEDELEFQREELYEDGSYAVIVQIEAYHDDDDNDDDDNDNGVSNLLPTHDGELIRATLQARNFTIVGELYNEEATHVNILDMLDDVKNMLRGKPNARFCFFLVARGHRDRDRHSWIQCYGADILKLHRTCLKFTVISEFARCLDAKHQLYILDCDHADSILLGNSSMPSTWETQNIGLPAIYGMTPRTKTQERLMEEHHSVFTKSLADILNMKSIRTTQSISLVELFEMLEDKVQEHAEQKHQLQTPLFSPMCELHGGSSNDGQMIFFSAEAVNFVAGSAAIAVRKKNKNKNKKQQQSHRHSIVDTNKKLATTKQSVSKSHGRIAM